MAGKNAGLQLTNSDHPEGKEESLLLSLQYKKQHSYEVSPGQ
jgi:hypothetical protein